VSPARVRARELAVAAIVVVTVLFCTFPPAHARHASQAQHTPGKVPGRVVSLVPACTEMLFAVGAGPLVVGVSSFDRYPPEVATRTRVGALLDPDLERIIALKPDLVIIDASQDELRTQLRRASIGVFEHRTGDLAQIVATIRALGERVGRATEAERVASRMESDIAAVRAGVASRPRPRVLLVFGRESRTLRNIFASGGKGFLHEVLDAAGGENIFADVNRESVQATTELILARQPEVIVELRATGLAGGAGDAPDNAWRALPSVPAVRNGRIYVLVGDDLVVPGPRIAEATARLARVLHPER
jgi:iron complex transport system substrate-binding protein